MKKMLSNCVSAAKSAVGAVVGFGKQVVKVVKENGQKIALAVGVATITLAPAAARAGYDIVSQDGSGNVTFTPGGLVTPVITGVIAAVGASAALVVIGVGVRWIYRLIKSK